VVAALLLVSGVALVLSFLQTVRDYRSLPDLAGSPIVLGVPGGAFAMTLSGAALVLAVALAARHRTQTQTQTQTQTDRNIPQGVALLALGIIGWYAAYALAVDKVLAAVDPSTDLDCNVSLLVQCGANLQSWQGSVFGFPNPLIGLVGWAAVVVIGCLLLAGIRLAPWFWIVANVGVTGALAFVIWLISQSIFVLGTLCPWCMVTWAVTIPLFWAVTLHNAKEGRFGESARRLLGSAYGWVPLITVASYIVVAVIAQFRLDLLTYLTL
jgi:uncharacterized membrane protein